MYVVISTRNEETFGEYKSHAWFKNRAYKREQVQIFKLTSDGLMQKHSNSFIMSTPGAPHFI